MDKSTLPGLLLAFACIVVSIILEGGELSHLVSVPAFILVIGASVSVGMLISPLGVFLQLPKIMLKAVLDKPTDVASIIESFVGLADKARREGLLALEQEAQNLEPFARKGVLMVVDGSDPHLVREIMEAEVEAMQRRHKSGYSIFESMGAYSPTIGIVGTTTGLIHVLGNLASPEKLGHAIASAFIATLYGVASANIFFLPMSQKLKAKSAEEIAVRELIIEGVMSVQAGDNPRMVREKLEAHLAPAKRSKGDGPGGASQQRAA